MTVRMIRAQGDVVSRGRTVGRELGDLIERSLAFYRGYFEGHGLDGKRLQEALRPYMVASEARLPRLVAYVRAMAEGAMVPVWELFAINAFEEIEPLLERPGGTPPVDRCSSFTVRGPDFTLIGHNEQWLAGDASNVAVVIDVPSDGPPAVASPTVVCCLPAVGLNENGAALGVQSLVADDDGVGVPRVLVSRHALDALDRTDAMRRVSLEGRAGGYGYVWAFATGDACMIEATATDASILEGPGPHTNHYLDPALAAGAPDPSAGSVARYEGMLELIEDRQPATPEEVMSVLRDHESEPQSICLHADPTKGEEAAAVLFSMVADVEHGRMWVAVGNPCETPYEEIDLTGVVHATR